MARLNDPQPPGGESIEALKKRYIRQNREIARANSAQSIRIRTLEGETAQLLEENITLRKQVIHLTSEIDRRDRSAELLENVNNTKKELEKKLKEMTALLGGLGLQMHGSNRDKIITGPKPVGERVWKNEYLIRMEQQEGLASIKEDTVYSRKSLSMEDVPILSPTHTHTPASPSHDNDSDNELPPEPTFSSFLDMRPRRRRDSTFINSTAKLSPRNETSPLDPPIRTFRPDQSTLSEDRPPKRKFQFEDSSSPHRRISFGVEADDIFTFRIAEKQENFSSTATAEAAADEALRRLSSEPWSKVAEGNRRLSGGSESGNSHKENKQSLVEEKPVLSPVVLEPVEERKKRISLAGVSANVVTVITPQQPQPQPTEKFNIEDFGEIDLAPKPRRASISSSSTTTLPRKALGTKPANVSPQKPHSFSEKHSDPLLKLKALDLISPEKSLLKDPYPITELVEFKSGVGNVTRPHSDTGGRVPRRAAAQQINYALPRLNTKMRRETIEPEKPKKIRASKKTARENGASSLNHHDRSRATSVESEISIHPKIDAETDDDDQWSVASATKQTEDPGIRKGSSLFLDRGGEREGELEEGGGLRGSKKRMSLAFGDDLGPEEREKGRSSFGGGSAGGVADAVGTAGDGGSKTADRRRTMLV